MNTNKVLDSLDNSWSRKKVLLNLREGLNPDDIVDQFLFENKENIENLCIRLQPRDIDSLKHMEELSTCEAKLIKKLNDIYNNKNFFVDQQKFIKKTEYTKKSPNLNFGLFMIKWSNKFVVFALLIISAIALSKQAWT